MTDDANTPLTLLQERLAAKAEKAYGERDAAEAISARAFAAGKSHAYAIAESEVRKLLPTATRRADSSAAGGTT